MTDSLLDRPHRYDQIQDGLNRFLAGTLSSQDLKPVLAPSGIYEQRDGHFMMRVRITGGHLQAASLRDLATLMQQRAIPWAHFSSREAIQLHHIPATQILEILRDCEAIGLPFRGGGGNTYRNVLASPDSGVRAGQAFDILPYAQAVNRALSQIPGAFTLPRKFKIGFFCNPEDEFTAAYQDLGFLATLQDGQKGFVVYGGGGLGRECALGLRLIRFLPHDRFMRCTLAMLQLFSEHGDRTSRATARLRYVLRRLGPQEFQRLFDDYYHRQPDTPVIPELPRASATPPAPAPEEPLPGYADWEAIAVAPGRQETDQVVVRLFVPHGNFSASEGLALAQLAEEFADAQLRLTQGMEVLLAPVAKAALPALYNRLIRDFPGTDLTLNSLKGHIVSCVGAATCKIGILPSPTLADDLALKLDSRLPLDVAERARLIRKIVDGIRISGCPNSCSGHPAAWLGFQGSRRRADGGTEDILLPFRGRSTDPDSLSLSSPAAEPLPLKDVADYVAAALGLPSTTT